MDKGIVKSRKVLRSSSSNNLKVCVHNSDKSRSLIQVYNSNLRVSFCVMYAKQMKVLYFTETSFSAIEVTSPY